MHGWGLQDYSHYQSLQKIYNSGNSLLKACDITVAAVMGHYNTQGRGTWYPAVILVWQLFLSWVTKDFLRDSYADPRKAARMVCHKSI